MKLIVNIMVGLLLAGFVTSCSAPSNDTTLQKSVVGKWKFQNAEFTAITTYKSDSTFSGQLAPAEADFRIDVSGTWQIKDGEMISVVTNSSAPKMISIGHTSTDKLISISDKERTFDDGTDIRTEIRME